MIFHKLLLLSWVINSLEAKMFRGLLFIVSKSGGRGLPTLSIWTDASALSQNHWLGDATWTQNDIPTDDISKRSIRLGCDFGWFFYLLNLKSVYEGGLDLRNKDEELKGMLNN